jgi:hypothetical protein
MQKVLLLSLSVQPKFSAQLLSLPVFHVGKLVKGRVG